MARGCLEESTALSMCILVAYPVFHFFFGGHVQEAAQFFVQLLADLLPSEQRSEATGYVSQQGHDRLRLQDSGDRGDLPAPFSGFAAEPLASLICQGVILCASAILGGFPFAFDQARSLHPLKGDKQ